MALEINLLRAVTLPVRLCTSLVLLGDGISIRSCIFSGLAFMPPLADHKPKKFSSGHAECALERVQLHVIRPEDIERIGQVCYMVRCNLGLDEHVVCVNLHFLANLFLEHHIK